MATRNGAGGIVEGNIPLICGGYSGECYKLHQKTWIKAANMKTPRRKVSTGNVVINEKLWISGGYDGESKFASTELVHPQYSENYVDLPIAMTGHCSINFNASHILLIGGNSGKYRNETHFLHIQNGQWSSGPSLNQERSGHGCTKTLVNNKPVIFVTGGYGGERLNSVEFLDMANPSQGWQKGLYFLHKV